MTICPEKLKYHTGPRNVPPTSSWCICIGGGYLPTYPLELVKLASSKLSPSPLQLPGVGGVGMGSYDPREAARKGGSNTSSPADRSC